METVPRKAGVYFVYCPRTDLIKIGKANNIRSRIELSPIGLPTLKDHYHQDLRFLGWIPSQFPRKLEHEIQSSFANLRREYPFLNSDGQMPEGCTEWYARDGGEILGFLMQFGILIEPLYLVEAVF